MSSLGEFELIAGIAAKLAPAPQGIVGIGDDCAVLPAADGRSLLLTTDALVENRHFRLSQVKPFLLGRKLVSITLSDIAAMGGKAKAILINMQLPPDLPDQWVMQMYDGVASGGAEYGVPVIGGNTTAAGEISFCATALGEMTAKPLLRSGAGVGDDLWVSGVIGGAGLGLQLLEGTFEQGAFTDEGEEVLRCFENPEARLELGEILTREALASAAIDVSDGLIQDAEHLAAESGVDVEINIDAVPLVSSMNGADALRLRALSSGEDYEILFTAPVRSTRRLAELKRPAVTKIGTVLERSGERGKVLLRFRDGTRAPARQVLAQGGFDHFSRE